MVPPGALESTAQGLAAWKSSSSSGAAKSPLMVSISKESALCPLPYGACGPPEMLTSAGALLLAVVLGIFITKGVSQRSPSSVPICGPMPEHSAPSSGPGLGSQVLLDGVWLPLTTASNRSHIPF